MNFLPGAQQFGRARRATDRAHPPRVQAEAPGSALRHRCKVMTLTPSVRAISRCSFPRVANSFARASFVAIFNLECFLLAMTNNSTPDGTKSSKRGTIAARQINIMGRSVRCKRLLRYVIRVPFASRNGDVPSPLWVGGGEAD